MSFGSQYETICDMRILVNNSNLSRISHRLAAIVRNGLQGHPRSMISI